MKCKIAILGALLFVSGYITSYAQETFAAAGGDASGSGGSFSFTVGQLFYASGEGGSLVLSEGIMQAFDIYFLVGIEEADIDLSISAYPIPAQHFLNIEIGAAAMQDFESLHYQLFDMNGRLVLSEKIKGSVTIIETANLNSATYFVKILNNKRELKTFKVIKY